MLLVVLLPAVLAIRLPNRLIFPTNIDGREVMNKNDDYEYNNENYPYEDNNLDYENDDSDVSSIQKRRNGHLCINVPVSVRNSSEGRVLKSPIIEYECREFTGSFTNQLNANPICRIQDGCKTYEEEKWPYGKKKGESGDCWRRIKMIIKVGCQCLT